MRGWWKGFIERCREDFIGEPLSQRLRMFIAVIVLVIVATIIYKVTQ